MGFVACARPWAGQDTLSPQDARRPQACFGVMETCCWMSHSIAALKFLAL